LAQARDGATVLRVLGDHPDDKASVEVCSGRYGPYARHGKINATLPKGVSPDDITLDEALELIAAKAAKGGGKTKKPAAKPAKAKPTKTKAAAKTAKPASTKPKAAKTTTKKPAAGKVKKPATKKVVAAKKAVKTKNSG
jgi:DNA topoisomerase-1